MLSYLDLNELKAAREVSRRWNLIATQFFYPYCSKVELSFNADNYWTNAKNYGIEEMKDFVRLVEMSGECPFSKFDIGTSIIKSAHEEIVTDFFQVCGQYMEQLTVRDDWGKLFFRRGLPEKMEFNSLRKLKVHLLQASVDTVEHFFEFVTRIMKASPYLEHLALVSHNGFDSGETVECLIKSLVECGCAIKTLEIEAQMQDVHLISLSTMGLKLTHLSVDFWGSQFTDSTPMKTFLASQSDTLESFKLADVAMSSLCVIEFPCMKELRTLKIKGSMLGRISVSFPHISFVDQFPNLKTLSFSDLFGEWDEFLKTGLKPSLTVEELKLPCDFVDSLCLQRAAYLFPRLKKLEVPHYQHLIDVVYELMPHLEELTINTRYISLVDDIITGIPHELCTAINKDSCYERILMNNELQEYQTSKSIASLTSELFCLNLSQYLKIYMYIL